MRKIKELAGSSFTLREIARIVRVPEKRIAKMIKPKQKYLNLKREA